MQKNENINALFGNELKKRREAIGLSQREFARKCDISFAYYGRIERGEHSITLSMLQLIANYLEIRLSDFFIDMP